MVLAADFFQRVAQRLEEVLVGREHLAVEPELDHRLRLADRRELALEVGVAQLSAVMSVAYFTTLNGLPLTSMIGL